MPSRKPRRSSDSRQLRRQWALLQLLSSSGRSFTVKELAEQLACSKSTVERDIATLDGLFPVVEERAGVQKRRYRIAARMRELEVVQPFGVMQLMAVHAALQMLARLEGAPFYDDLRSLAHVIRAALASRHNGGLDRLARVFLASPRGDVDHAAHAEVIDDLVDAIAQHKQCRLRTSGDGDAGGDVIHPLHMFMRNRELGLVYRRAKRRDVRAVRVRDIAALESSRETFSVGRVSPRALHAVAFGGDASEDDSE